jgi:hypothetical protein
MPDDYEVGFGRPPKHTQFKKKQSGNPDGRPKNNLATAAVKQLKSSYYAKNGKKFSGREGATRGAVIKSFQGNTAALIALRKLEKEAEEQKSARKPVLPANHAEILARYRAKVIAEERVKAKKLKRAQLKRPRRRLHQRRRLPENMP